MAEVKTYAWNFRIIDGDALVLRAVSQDSIGVLKLVGDQLEFWCLGQCVARSKSLSVIFRAIDATEEKT